MIFPNHHQQSHTLPLSRSLLHGFRLHRHVVIDDAVEGAVEPQRTGQIDRSLGDHKASQLSQLDLNLQLLIAHYVVSQHKSERTHVQYVSRYVSGIPFNLIPLALESPNVR